MNNSISHVFYSLEKYPTVATILVAFIGLIGIIVTQIIIHANAEYDKRRERVTDYIGSLRLQVLCTHDRLAVLRARRIEVGIKNPKSNSMKYIDGKKVTCYEDIHSDIENLEWCYHSGFNLCSVCYLLACLIAQCYRTKQHLEILHLRKKKLNKIIDYLLQIEGIFDENFGIWQVTQYDIALSMLKNQNDIISFYDFCKSIPEKQCLANLFDFFLSIADYGRREQELDLIIVLYDFYYFLEKLMYPSVFSFRLLTVFLRKHLCLGLRQTKIKKGRVKREAKNINPKDCSKQPEDLKSKQPEFKNKESESEKAIELKNYLHTTYLKKKRSEKEKIRKNRFERFFMSYYDIAVAPISSYITMRGLNELYKKK